jgi:hypothetical protein
MTSTRWSISQASRVASLTLRGGSAPTWPKQPRVRRRRQLLHRRHCRVRVLAKMTRSTVERRRKLAFSSALCFSSDSAPNSAACAHRLRRMFQRPYRLQHRRQGRLRLLQLPLQQHPLPHPLLRRLPCRLRHRRQGRLQLHPKCQRTPPIVNRLQHQQQRRALNPRVLPLLLPQVHRAYRLPSHPRLLRQQDTPL